MSEPLKQPEQTKFGRRAIGAKLRRVGDPEGYNFNGIGHWCPACRAMHAVAIDQPNAKGEQWQWNGSMARPTFTPEINIAWGDQADARYKGLPGGRCHYTLTDGVITFFPDCSHVLRNMSVALPDLPGHLRD